MKVKRRREDSPSLTVLRVVRRVLGVRYDSSGENRSNESSSGDEGEHC